MRRSAYRSRVRKYQYVLRFPDHDQITVMEHPGHEVGDRVEIDGTDWVVESIAQTRRWPDVDRALLRPMQDPLDPAGPTA